MNYYDAVTLQGNSQQFGMNLFLVVCFYCLWKTTVELYCIYNHDLIYVGNIGSFQASPWPCTLGGIAFERKSGN